MTESPGKRECYSLRAVKKKNSEGRFEDIANLNKSYFLKAWLNDKVV
jgi:hypothetical protein